MHRSLDSRSFGKPQSMFIYGKTSLEKIGSKRRERERAHFFFFLFLFFSQRGKSMSRWVQQSHSFTSKSLNCSSFSRNRHAFQIRDNPLQRSTKKNAWPRKQKSSTYINFSVWEHNSRIHLYYLKLINFSIYFFPVPFKTFLIIWRKRGYKCQKGIFPTVCGTGHAFH